MATPHGATRGAFPVWVVVCNRTSSKRYLARTVGFDQVRPRKPNLAAAQDNEDAGKNRDIVAEKMTPADISKAQAMAREWMEKHGQ